MMASRHLGDQLQDFLDGQLGEADRSRVEAHLAGCASCRRELEALRWVRTEALPRLSDEPAPPGLAGRVRQSLDRVDAESRLAAPGPARSRPGRWALASGLLAVAALLVLLLTRPSPVTVPDLVTRDFATFVEGGLPLGLESSDPRAIESFFAASGVTFPTRVFDLGMMQYTLLGGRIHRHDGRTSALFAYRGADSRLLVCQMYEGTTTGLPVADETREFDGIAFKVYRRGSTTLVFWQEGALVCVLASDAPYETVIALARAKAVKV